MGQHPARQEQPALRGKCAPRRLSDLEFHCIVHKSLLGTEVVSPTVGMKSPEGVASECLPYEISLDLVMNGDMASTPCAPVQQPGLFGEVPDGCGPPYL